MNYYTRRISAVSKGCYPWRGGVPRTSTHWMGRATPPRHVTPCTLCVAGFKRFTEQIIMAHRHAVAQLFQAISLRKSHPGTDSQAISLENKGSHFPLQNHSTPRVTRLALLLRLQQHRIGPPCRKRHRGRPPGSHSRVARQWTLGRSSSGSGCQLRSN